MKTALFCISAFSALLFFSSCDKNSPTAPNYPIVGLWTGTYMVTSEGPQSDSLYYSFDLKSDSSMLVQGLGADGNTYYGIGKWSLTGTAFSATITTINLGQYGAVQKATAIYSSTTGLLNSGVVQSVPASYTASFHLSRIN
jgi:hypothetical protein